MAEPDLAADGLWRNVGLDRDRRAAVDAVSCGIFSCKEVNVMKISIQIFALRFAATVGKCEPSSPAQATAADRAWG
jgi:hypothetical protein